MKTFGESTLNGLIIQQTFHGSFSPSQIFLLHLIDRFIGTWRTVNEDADPRKIFCHVLYHWEGQKIVWSTGCCIWSHAKSTSAHCKFWEIRHRSSKAAESHQPLPHHPSRNLPMIPFDVIPPLIGPKPPPSLDYCRRCKKYCLLNMYNAWRAVESIKLIWKLRLYPLNRKT